MNRRTVLKGVGAGAIAGVGLTGTASAHRVRGEPVFCGCDRLCVCVEGNADVLVARETDDGGYEVGFLVGDGEIDPYPTGEPRYSGDFCVSTESEGIPDGQIIGLQVAGTRWVNPNECAQAALEAEREQLDSTHERPAGESGDACGSPPCDDDGGGIEVTWEDCETVSVTGSGEGLDEIIFHPLRCFPGDGPCPDGVPGGRNIENPTLPLTIDHRYLAVDDDVPYYIAGIELRGDVEQDTFGKPNSLDCGFETDDIEITFEDCETVTLSGPDEDLEKIELYLVRCFEDPGEGCPDGQIVTRENPDLPLTLGRDELAVGDEVYRIDAVDLFGDVTPDDATPPDDLDCSFDTGEDIDVTFEDCETVTLTGDDTDLDGIDVYYQRCFEDPGEGCPDGAQATFENPTLPLTIGRNELATGDEQIRIDGVDLIGDVTPDDATPPEDFDCRFE
ncbi:hypothetical protein GJ629_02305 [Halapricum sp. CBA1109]|uniref:twin-arginine translocation signal domain-containing protein n=1 Tax=Halapricum sp. CBA1109 TaxID=2668068 RepID=UPI0012F773C0|nr:twin-arginine translocation signal domain-containing protein [Halapricum sp. CBA1109]MUV88871.1 hypothetical protein [Halapricum sp. CBA1109]